MSDGTTDALRDQLTPAIRMTREPLDTFHPSIVEFCKQIGLTFVDIGARGGLDSALLPLAAGVVAIGFEPEPLEAALLHARRDRRWRDVQILPFAVGGVTGAAKLFVPPASEGASLIPHNPAMLDRFGYDDLHSASSIIEVSTVTLDHLYTQNELRRADYLKIDVEGAELSVLHGAKRLLQNCKSAKIECSFVEQRMGQPLVADVAAFMLAQGFELVDIIDIHRWRRRPLPAHPYNAAFGMPYSRGQVAQCDLILLRRAETLNDLGDLVALVLVAACLGYFDLAIYVLRDRPEIERFVVSECGVSLERELNRMSRVAGRQASLSEIRRSLRNLVPLARSLLGGLPVGASRRPY